ncbi:hypothetical protein V1525DRAFT_357635, partial [Lipomyces kononenkoae]
MAPDTRSHHLRPQSEARRNSPTRTPPPARPKKYVMLPASLKGDKSKLGSKRRRVPVEKADEYMQQLREEEEKEIAGQDTKEIKDEEQQPEEKKPKLEAEPSTKAEAGEGAIEVPKTVLEEGLIYFFFRPKVGTTEASSVEDVQRTYVVLRPLPFTSTDMKDTVKRVGRDDCRMIIIPKKTLPTTGGGRLIGLVTKVHSSVDDITDQLDTEKYSTKTRGERTLPSARPIAEGVYVLTQEDNMHYLSYILTVPQEQTEVESEFGISQDGRYIVSARNPKYPVSGPIKAPEGAKYSEEMLKEFQDYRWVPLVPKHMDYLNGTILFIGTRHGPEELLEENADELMTLEKENEERIQKTFQGDAAKAVFHDLHMKRDTFVDKDLKGTW